VNVVVSNSAQLTAAISSAVAGDTISLAAGNYSYLSLSNVKFPGNVTIISADATKPALIEGVMLTNCQGLTFSNLDLGFTLKLNGSMQVLGSTNITLNGIELVGTPDRVGNGLIIRNSDNVTVTNTDIHGFSAGIGHQDSTHVTISNSKFHDLSMDGVRGGGSSWVTINANTFTDFHKVQYAHNDAIQFWTSGTTASVHDLVITNNTVTRGSGDAVQGIFMNNELGFTYQNVTITGNAIIGPGYHGITVEKANNVRIDGNLIQGYKDLGGWIQVKNSSNFSLQHNVSTSWINDNNTLITSIDNKTIKLGDLGDVSILNYWNTHGHTVPDSIVTGNAPAGTTGGIAPPVAPDAGRLLIGTTGSDSLLGGSGNDTLDGRGGADTMTGGAGDDVYVDNGWGSYATEGANGGTDTVRTSLENYTLRSFIEKLTLTGTAAQRGNGNASNNVITGNAVKNQVSGGDGNDTLISIGGVDTLTGGAGRDVFSFTKMPSGMATITDFARLTDVLDIRGLLPQAYGGQNPVLDGYVRFSLDLTGTTVAVDIDGRTGPGGFVNVVKLNGVLTTLSNLEFVWSRGATTYIEGVDFGGADDPLGALDPFEPLEPLLPFAPTGLTTTVDPTSPTGAPGVDTIDLDAIMRSLSGVGWVMA
jgi:Ca2+-binding RTX toxin-like protein